MMDVYGEKHMKNSTCERLSVYLFTVHIWSCSQVAYMKVMLQHRQLYIQVMQGRTYWFITAENTERFLLNLDALCYLWECIKAARLAPPH